jgi:nucleotide-binding universal stress UspA family protein
MGGEKLMQITKILWASDGSKQSRDALRWAEMLANQFGATLIGFSVIETLNCGTSKMPSVLRKTILRIDSETEKKEMVRLTQVRKALEKKGIKSVARIARGVAPQEIIKAARGGTIDLIVMGKRGQTPWGRLLLGSTTARVLREGHVPLLAVRRAARKLAVKKILLPTSFSPKDSVSFEWALELARKFGAALFVLYVIEVHRSYHRVKGGFIGRLRESADKQLRAILDSVPTEKQKGVSLTHKVMTFTRARSGIVNFAHDQGIDMIVMSTNARKGVPRFFLGSVAEAVIEEAPCPVIAVPPLSSRTGFEGLRKVAGRSPLSLPPHQNGECDAAASESRPRALPR